MANTVKIGSMNVPKPALLAGMAGAAAIIIYAYWARSRGGGTETPSSDDTGSNIDPSTGLPYSDEFGFGGGYSGIGINDPATGGTIGGGYGGQIVTQLTTNSQWTQAAVLYLEQHGYEGTAIANALGKVLTGSVVTQAELSIFNAARAAVGEPPQTYPSPHMASTAPPGTTNPSGASLPAPGNVHVIHRYRTEIQVDWNAVKGARGYAVYRSEPAKSASTWQRQSTSVYDSFQFKGLKPNTTYRFKIAPVGFDNKEGKSVTITGKTLK
jgi:hypothetical protein